MAYEPFARLARGVALLLATVIIVGFAVLVALSYAHADTAGTDHWSHLVKILETVSPLAGLAVGWIFGKEVHRKEAQAAKDAARGYEKDAKRGHALATAVRTAASIAASDRSSTEASSATELAPSTHWKALVDQAEALFPATRTAG
jgi:hypothetical protein